MERAAQSSPAETDKHIVSAMPHRDRSVMHDRSTIHDTRMQMGLPAIYAIYHEVM